MLKEGFPVQDSIGANNNWNSTRRKPVLLALIIFGAALAIRVSFFTVQVSHNPEAWSRAAPFNHAEMGNIAVNLYEGRGYSSPFSKGSTPTAWLCPLVPFLWAWVMSLVHAANGFTARVIVYIDAVASALSVVVYWLIAQYVGNRAALDTRVTPMIVAALFCIWPESLFALANPWYFEWQELGTALLVLFAMQWIDRPNYRTVTPLAIVGGVLALINITPIPILAVAFSLPVLGSKDRRARPFRSAAFGVTLAFLIVLPWLARDAVVFRSFVPLRSAADYSLWEGNNPNGCVRETRHTPHPAQLGEEFDVYQKLGEMRFSQLRLHDALDYMREHPLDTAVRIGQRAYVIFFSDVLDQWSWDGRKWWEQDFHVKSRALVITLSAWGTVVLMSWVLLSKRFSRLPYKWLFMSVLFLLPLPMYFTFADYEYSQILRSWLLLIAILAIQPTFPARVHRWSNEHANGSKSGHSDGNALGAREPGRVPFDLVL